MLCFGEFVSGIVNSYYFGLTFSLCLQILGFMAQGGARTHVCAFHTHTHSTFQYVDNAHALVILAHLSFLGTVTESLLTFG